MFDRWAVPPSLIAGDAKPASWLSWGACKRLLPAGMLQPVLQTDCGLPLFSGSDKCIQLLDAYCEQVMLYGSNLSVAVRAAEADSSCCLANILAGVFCLSAEKRDPKAPRQPFLKRAEEQVARGHCTAYERSLLQCIQAVASGDLLEAVARHLRLLEAWPQDLVSLKRAQTLAFYVGRQDLMLRLAETVQKKNTSAPFYHGCLAFALLEADRLEGALAAAKTGLALRDDDPWAQHAVCHVYHHRCQFEEAIGFMRERQHHWQQCSPFMYIHNWWHISLCYLDMGRPADIQMVLDIFDQHIWKEEWREQGRTEDCLNGLGLLLGLELRGHGDCIQARLEQVAARLENECLWHVELLLDLFACWALHRTKRREHAQRLSCSMEAVAIRKKKGPRGEALLTGWLPLARALAHFAADEIAQAAEALRQTDWKSLKVIGASDEQLDVFEEVQCRVLMAEGRCEEALAMLEKRVGERERVPFTHVQLARCRQSLGDIEGAHNAQKRAEAIQASFAI